MYVAVLRHGALYPLEARVRLLARDGHGSGFRTQFKLLGDTVRFDRFDLAQLKQVLPQFGKRLSMSRGVCVACGCVASRFVCALPAESGAISLPRLEQALVACGLEVAPEALRWVYRLYADDSRFIARTEPECTVC